MHTQSEAQPWEINIADHTKRTDSPDYKKARALMQKIVSSIKGFYYGEPRYDDHHGGGLWLKDSEGWFLIKALVGIEWSAQYCADPVKVDRLRVNAKRLYAQFPFAAKELGITQLLETPITDAAGIARWTDSICNASVPLPPLLHTGVLPKGGGVHHYPTPITDIQLFKHDDFILWVKDEEGEPAAVAPVAPRGSGDGRVQVLMASPGTKLDKQHRSAQAQGDLLILPDNHVVSKRAFRLQGESSSGQEKEKGRKTKRRQAKPASKKAGGKGAKKTNHKTTGS